MCFTGTLLILLINFIRLNRIITKKKKIKKVNMNYYNTGGPQTIWSLLSNNSAEISFCEGDIEKESRSFKAVLLISLNCCSSAKEREPHALGSLKRSYQIIQDSVKFNKWGWNFIKKKNHFQSTNHKYRLIIVSFIYFSQHVRHFIKIKIKITSIKTVCRNWVFIQILLIISL